MVQILEWFQCKGCGRRHRWRAEIAGTEIECTCGAMVFCPELDVFGDKPTAEDTLGDPEATIADPEVTSLDELFPAQSGQYRLEGEKDAESVRRVASGGLFGMSPTTEVVLWLVLTLIGFSMVVHAVIVQTIWYIVLACLIFPISLFKLMMAKRRWQGNRTFSQAVAQTLGSD